MLDKAIAYTEGATTIEHEFEELSAGRKQLWLVIDNESTDPPNKTMAACVSSLEKNEDGSKTAWINLTGGENMKAWCDLRERFAEWAKAEGCKDIRLWARKGWAKYLLDFKLTHYLMRRELT